MSSTGESRGFHTSHHFPITQTFEKISLPEDLCSVSVGSMVQKSTTTTMTVTKRKNYEEETTNKIRRLTSFQDSTGDIIDGSRKFTTSKRISDPCSVQSYADEYSCEDSDIDLEMKSRRKNDEEEYSVTSVTSGTHQSDAMSPLFLSRITTLRLRMSPQSSPLHARKLQF